MSKAYQSQSIFFACGVLCTLTVYDGDCSRALSRAKALAQTVDTESSFAHPVAVGRAAREIRRIFAQEGVTQAVIRLGDTVVNMGATRRIGIRNPFYEEAVNFAFLDVGSKAIVTLYQDAADSRGDLASVTLIGDDAAQLSKMCAAVIGYSLHNAFALLDGAEVEAIFVTKDEQVFTTGGLSREHRIAA